MLEFIRGLFHRILEPHCPDCQAREDDKWQREHICNNCENYLNIIEKQRQDYNKLLEKLTNTSQQSEEVVNQVEFKPIVRRIPWNVRKQMLEQEDRNKFNQMKIKTTEQLEQELGVADK